MAEAHRDEIAKLEALYASNPEGRVFTHLAEAYRKAGDLDLAAQVLEQGLQRHPDSASGFIVLGRVHFDRGERERAAGAFRRALELDSGNLVAHRLLGELAMDQDAPDEALRHYRELLDRNPGDPALQEQVAALSHPSEPAGEPEAPALAEAGPEPWEASVGEGDQPGPERYGELSELAGGAEPARAVAGDVPAADIVAAEEQRAGPYEGEPDSESEAVPYLAAPEPTHPWGPGMVAELPLADDLVPGDAADRADLLAADLSLEALPVEAEEEYADLPPLEVAAFEPEEEYADLPPLEPLPLPDEAFAEGELDDVGLPALEPIGGEADGSAPEFGAIEPELTGPEAFEAPAPAWAEPAEADHSLALYDEERAAAHEREPAEPSELEVPEAGPGLLTETMAELYRSQGFHSRAAEVYRSLLRERSEDERLQQRLAEVEAELGAERRMRESPDMESVESAFTGGSGASGGEETPYAWSAADEGIAGAGVAIGDYFRKLLSWSGSATVPASEGPEDAGTADAAEAPGVQPAEFWLEQPAAAGWTPEELGGAEVVEERVVEELVLEPADEASWTPAEPMGEPAGESGWTPDELLREPAEPMPWDTTSVGDAAAAPASESGGDLMPWELPEPPGLEPAAAGEPTAPTEDERQAAAEAIEAADRAAGEDEAAEDEDEDLEMFRSWLQSLKK